jgi:hypothetical protein
LHQSSQFAVRRMSDVEVCIDFSPERALDHRLLNFQVDDPACAEMIVVSAASPELRQDLQFPGRGPASVRTLRDPTNIPFPGDREDGKAPSTL